MGKLVVKSDPFIRRCVWCGDKITRKADWRLVKMRMANRKIETKFVCVGTKCEEQLVFDKEMGRHVIEFM